MTGLELYNMYVRKLLELSNCLVESWEHLTEEDKIVWNALAADMQLRSET